MRYFEYSKCIFGLLAVVLAVGLAAGCERRVDEASGANGPKAYPYRIVTTVAMIADITRNIAGDKAAVAALIGEGVDPHLYKPTRDDVAKLNGADVILYNGLMLEGKMADTFVRMARSGKPVQAVTEAILADGAYVMTGEDQHYDPHIWMDVGGWMRAVEVITKTLSEFDPTNADQYRRNADAYLQQLKQLDDYARTSIASIPPSQRVLVTAHDAFGYLGRAYGIEVRGVQGLSTESEAGVMDIESLVQFLVDRKIPAVFVETSVADKNVRALVEGAQARGHAVRVGGSLFSDAMGPGGTYEGTYIGMLDHNITTLTRSLGGSAPERGMLGRLRSHP